VTLKSKIGLHAETDPIKILLPRDLHIGNSDFDEVDVGQTIEFEVVGSRFQQGDETIVVLGKLLEVIRPAVQKDEAEPEAQQVIAAPVGTGDSEKRTVTVALEKTKTQGDARRKKMVRTVAPSTNEPKPEGKSEGTAGAP
jgi:hypothetical protein